MQLVTEKRLRKIIGEHVNAALTEEREGFNKALEDLIKQQKEWEQALPAFDSELPVALAKLQVLRGIKDMFNYYIKFKFWHFSN
jgi:hypothetical protein